MRSMIGEQEILLETGFTDTQKHHKPWKKCNRHLERVYLIEIYDLSLLKILTEVNHV